MAGAGILLDGREPVNLSHGQLVTENRVWRVDRTEFCHRADRTLFTYQSWKYKLPPAQCGSRGNSKWLFV